MASGICTRGDSAIIGQVAFPFSYTIAANSSKSFQLSDSSLSLDPTGINFYNHHFIITGFSSGNDSCIVNRITPVIGGSTTFNNIMTIKNLSSSQKTGTAKIYITLIPTRLVRFNSSAVRPNVARQIFRSDTGLSWDYDIDAGKSKNIKFSDTNVTEPGKTVGCFCIWGGQTNVTCRNVNYSREYSEDNVWLAVKNNGSTDLTDLTAEVDTLCAISNANFSYWKFLGGGS